MGIGRIDGLIRRRILVNYRADPSSIARLLPPPFRPQLVNGYAMLGVCLIRIERGRPSRVPGPVWISSENAAHRVAVEWTEQGSPRCGVYVARRDTSSRVQHALGSRVFPGQYQHSRFAVLDAEDGPGSRIEIHVRTPDGHADVDLVAAESEEFRPTRCFDSLEAASDFFAAGSDGYSPRRGSGRLDGLRLEAERWHVRSLHVIHAEAQFLARWTNLPPSALELDNALLMRDVAHRWRVLPALERPTATVSPA